MNIEKIVKNDCQAIKLIAKDGNKIIGRAYLYLIANDLHDRPYGLMEDVFVEPDYRKHGIGSQLVNALVQEAKAQKCYKLIGCSRNERPKVHELYQNLGFKDFGKEFRMDLE
ncbi:MAG: GNAT family N-acetyltransferase [Candidatus Magasanikbacteria bacterium CG10_big_fil_rev_8_21_14_0_10_40_10]|uniref:GNAT family N-acetyltransferase n=1 Tax=Candidatus Magasanikbacteria bacterium CG10_big_fil_rev_8_21_14_0_10_40_10 TaxID=1974648 RepID=A0A2M6W4I2_9BACT|nr:MAG: GNAT family N-acetyltransferase [Candidatus Magasanikbacteria bacterium CG10_big_fil_rev_8_21_14_0_10_40_10]